ncbi:MAG: T9SS type A sorting domain-containing protein [Saprospiraceae bacterium]
MKNLSLFLTFFFASLSAWGGNPENKPNNQALTMDAPLMWALPPSSATVDMCSGDPQKIYEHWLFTHGYSSLFGEGCGGLEWSHQIQENGVGGCPGAKVYTVKFTVTDDCNHQLEKTAIFVIIDNKQPLFDDFPQNIFVEAGCDADAAIDAWLQNMGGATATDDCDQDLEKEFELVSTVVGCPTVYTYRFAFGDDCHNWSSWKEATFTVDDTKAPAFIKNPSDKIGGCSADPQIGLQAWLDDMAGAEGYDGDCSNSSGEFELVNTETGCPTIYTYRFRFRDNCSNTTAWKNAKYTVVDNTAPSFTHLPQNKTVECGPNNDAQFEAWFNSRAGAQATDLCGDVTWEIYVAPLPGNCPGNYTYTVSFTPKDECGNMGQTKEATFKVADTQAPHWAFLPHNKTVECGPDSDEQMQTWLNNQGGGHALDECSSKVTWQTNLVALPGNCPGNYSFTATFTPVDECGNAGLSKAAVFKVQDTQAPQYTQLPVNKTVECGLMNEAQLQDWLEDHAGAKAPDLCGQVAWQTNLVILPGNCPNNRIYSATFTPLDECGNAGLSKAALFKIQDTKGPLISSAAESVFLQCSAANASEFEIWKENQGGAQAEDCSEFVWEAVAIYQNLWVNNPPCDFKAYMRFVATDACGNTSFSLAAFQAVDSEAPKFEVLPENKTVACMQGNDGEGDFYDWLDSFGSALIKDNCTPAEELTLEHLLLSEKNGCGNSWSKTYEFRATDLCNNLSKHIATFSVVDKEAPVVEFVPEGNPFLTCKADVPAADPTKVIATDNCTDNCTVTLKDTYQEGMSCPKWPMTVIYTYSVKDACGNEAICQQSFMVKDTTPLDLPAVDTFSVACVDSLPDADQAKNILKTQLDDACMAGVYLTILEDSGVNGLTRTFTVRAKDECWEKADTIKVTFLALVNSCDGINDNRPSEGRSSERRALAFTDLRLAPNPAEEATTLRFVSEKESEVQIHLLGADGSTKWQRNVQAMKGDNTVDISLQDLPAGIWQIVVQYGNDWEAVRLVKVKK